ncbi:MAG: hypothetical protein GPJ50_15580 [Candidatus Heimdallarchaeota archaeon]|nr:hypothetical protein [Candidatus Heimdallarchaeota archaeon]
MRRMGKTIYFSDKQLEVLFELVTMNIGTGYYLDVGEILDQLVNKIPWNCHEVIFEVLEDDLKVNNSEG